MDGWKVVKWTDDWMNEKMNKYFKRKSERMTDGWMIKLMAGWWKQ